MTPTRWWQNTKLCRYYAGGAAVVLIALGLVGFTNILGLGWSILAHAYHVALGLLFGLTGLLVRDKETVRLMVGGLGVLLVVVKGISVLGLLVVGENPLWGPIEMTCFVVGLQASW
jgi:hypothetical protein